MTHDEYDGPSLREIMADDAAQAASARPFDPKYIDRDLLSDINASLPSGDAEAQIDLGRELARNCMGAPGDDYKLMWSEAFLTENTLHALRHFGSAAKTLLALKDRP